MEAATTSALVLCSDPEASKVLDQAFAQFKIKPQIRLTSWAVQKELQEKDFDMLALDFDEPEASVAMEAWSRRGPNSSKVVIAFSQNAQTMKLEHRKYAHFYMQKPLTQWLLVKTLKVACGVVLKKRRATYRCTVNMKAQATLVLPGTREHKTQTVHMLDISQGGSCLKAEGVLPRGADVVLAFRLPETDDLIHASGKVVWGERTGMTGVQFTSIPNKELHRLGAWLDEKDPNALKVTLVDNPNEVRENSSRGQQRQFS